MLLRFLQVNLFRVDTGDYCGSEGALARKYLSIFRNPLDCCSMNDHSNRCLVGSFRSRRITESFHLALLPSSHSLDHFLA